MDFVDWKYILCVVFFSKFIFEKIKIREIFKPYAVLIVAFLIGGLFILSDYLNHGLFSFSYLQTVMINYAFATSFYELLFQKVFDYIGKKIVIDD